jgi:hypothetical protein
VQKGSDNAANDRGCQVQPGIVEITGRDHRAKRPRRVEWRAREGSTHDDVESQKATSPGKSKSWLGICPPGALSAQKATPPERHSTGQSRARRWALLTKNPPFATGPRLGRSLKVSRFVAKLRVVIHTSGGEMLETAAG